jgi:RNA polymerase sigma-70 factor (family 1)
MDLHSDFTVEEQKIILQKVAGGDQEAFKTLYLFFSERLLHFAFAIVKVKESSEEIVEDVFIKLWKSRGNLVHVQNIKVYLYSAIKNTALNHISKKAKESITEPFDHIDIELRENQDPERIMITSEMFTRLQKAVDTLPPRCKIIFKLIREDGLKYKEVAEILNISVNTIDAQMAIAVKKIAFALRNEVEQLKESKKIKELDNPF